MSLAIGFASTPSSVLIFEGCRLKTVIYRRIWCIKKLKNWNLNWTSTRICIFSWSPIWWIHKTVCKSWRHVCKKSAKRRVLSECLGGEFDFFTHWSSSAAFVEKDEADSCHRWPQYNALPGRFKGCYSFRYPNKVQLRFWLIQNFFWKPKSQEIDVPPLCEMHCRQPVLYCRWYVRTSTVSYRADSFQTKV